MFPLRMVQLLGLGAVAFASHGCGGDEFHDVPVRAVPGNPSDAGKLDAPTDSPGPGDTSADLADGDVATPADVDGGPDSADGSASDAESGDAPGPLPLKCVRQLTAPKRLDDPADAAESGSLLGWFDVVPASPAVHAWIALQHDKSSELRVARASEKDLAWHAAPPGGQVRATGLTKHNTVGAVSLGSGPPDAGGSRGLWLCETNTTTFPPANPCVPAPLTPKGSLDSVASCEQMRFASEPDGSLLSLAFSLTSKQGDEIWFAQPDGVEPGPVSLATGAMSAVSPVSVVRLGAASYVFLGRAGSPDPARVVKVPDVAPATFTIRPLGPAGELVLHAALAPGPAVDVMLGTLDPLAFRLGRIAAAQIDTFTSADLAAVSPMPPPATIPSDEGAHVGWAQGVALVAGPTGVGSDTLSLLWIDRGGATRFAGPVAKAAPGAKIRFAGVSPAGALGEIGGSLHLAWAETSTTDGGSPRVTIWYDVVACVVAP
jgi:hypothetical protein